MHVLFINPQSGNGDSVEEVTRAAEARGIEVRDLSQLDTEGADVLGAGGGDGSLAPVAAAALERDLPFVVVPLGTRNHFARDLGIDPDDPVAALDAFDAPERRIDVGRVNGRVFLNNVSLGAYAAAVHRDDSLVRWLLRFRRSPLRLSLDGEERKVLVLLIGNNEYDGRGRREKLDAGTLTAYSLERAPLLRLRRETEAGTAFVVNARRALLKAAIDGEPVELEAPLRFELEPRALRVRIAG